jgi:(1->4)-alpha-D-glucan 1-alpha-D-glucosylmutase
MPSATDSAPTHRPGPGRRVPVSTYRLQVHAGFGFDAVAEHAAYLASLGVTDLYLSPILQPAPGSSHGYDVVDHAVVHEEAGGREAFERLAARARELGLGIIVDVVPNHMTIPESLGLNRQLWALLREGPDAPSAAWFDIDWDASDGQVLMPVLGGPLEDVLAAGEISVGTGGPAGDEPVVRYYDREFPVRPGTEGLPLRELLDAQAYELADWRRGKTDLNYRRFFDVMSLKAVRVEEPEVFAQTHALLLELQAAGAIDGFRIDHPDGLADPQGYLADLAQASGDAWVVAEKILEGEEELPSSWRCAGTTGYDALLRVQQIFTDPSGAPILDRLWSEHAGTDSDYDAVVRDAKEHAVDELQAAEVNRLVRLAQVIEPGVAEGEVRIGLRELLVAMDRYRAYLRPGAPAPADQLAVLDVAVERARAAVGPNGQQAVDLVAGLARGAQLSATDDGVAAAAAEFVVRFQQTCGPVMAKGIEDTTFYRWLRLAGANEVGGDPRHLAIERAEFHGFCARQLDRWPLTMTALTTHDTKRSEGVRARLMVLAERAAAWDRWVHAASELGTRHRATGGDAGPTVDPATEYLIWQTLVGAWPISQDRIETYVLKAVREAKTHTAWVDGDADYEAAVVGFARGLVEDPAVVAHVESWLAESAVAIRANILGQKLVQLAMPGVADCYQGTERVTLTLVDPDNRAVVDFAAGARILAALDAGRAPASLDEEKVLVTATVLRLRKEHPEWFVGEQATYAGLPGPEHLLAFARGDDSGPQVLVLATRWAQQLADSGGWGAQTLTLPPGEWRDLLSPNRSGEESPVRARDVALADLLADRSVALLVRAS